MTVALDFIAQRTDHLRVTVVATLADEDIASGEFERRIGPHPGHLLDRALQVEERRDLDETADGDDDENADEEDDRVLLEDGVFVPQRHGVSLTRQEQRRAMT